MAVQYESVAFVRCPQTGDTDIVNVVDFTPRVSLTLDILVGTPHSRRVTLRWLEVENDYRTDLWGRTLVSRGPKAKVEKHRTQSRYTKFDKK